MAAERALVVALRRDEQRRDAVAIDSAWRVLPLGDHGEQPCGEPLAPQRSVGGHGAGEVAYVVVPVPCAFATGEVVAYGVERTHIVRLDVVVHIVLAHLYPLALHLKYDAAARAWVKRLEVGFGTARVAILCAVHYGVVAEGVAHGEEADHAVDSVHCVFVCCVFHVCIVC